MPLGKHRSASGKRYKQLARAHDMEYLKNYLAFCCISHANKPYHDDGTESDSDPMEFSAELHVSPRRVRFAPMPKKSRRKRTRDLKRQIVKRSMRDKHNEQKRHESEFQEKRAIHDALPPETLVEERDPENDG